MNFCLRVLNEGDGRVVSEGIKKAFAKELQEVHEEGYYLAYSQKKERWILSKKDKGKLELQTVTRLEMVERLFERI